MAEAPLLSVDDLVVEFGGLRAVDGLSLSVESGRVLGLVGESGSGKSAACAAVMGLLPTPPAHLLSGRIAFEGQDLRALSPRALNALRGDRLAMVFQDPMTTLNPYLTVGRQLAEVLEVHRGATRAAAWAASAEMLAQVGIAEPERRLRQHPHQLSGGLRQRVCLAMALLCRPRLLIADEPTTALDVTVQAQLLALLRAERDAGTGLILVTHDLGVLAGLADEVVVMYAGRAVERAPAVPLFESPAHPYTAALLQAVPRLDAPAGRLWAIPGAPAAQGRGGPGCAFAPRCARVRPECHQSPPTLRALAPGHAVACHFPQEVGVGKGEIP